jgi:hypothetical protein
VTEAPRRVRIASPHTDSPRLRTATRHHVGTREIEEATGAGEVYMRSLIGAQLRLALVVCGGLALSLGSLPLAFATAPGLGHVHVLGVPLFWLMLGGLVYPVLVAAGWWYVRAAERTERDFAELVRGR